MEWTTEYINNLPDSSFAHIEPGGKKDAEGKTVPRSLRHFPIKDENGKLDEAHVKNARQRMMQSLYGEKAKAKIIAAMKELGMGEMKESVDRDLIEAVTYAGKVDREKKIIHDVAILGKSSQNVNSAGKPRKYSDAALEDGKEIFEGSPVYLEHKEKKETEDLAGELQNLYIFEGQLRAKDFPVTEAKSWLLDIADRFPRQIGLSIKATGRVRETPDGELVEGFVRGRRRSVDVVTDPATVKNLFESVEKSKGEKTVTIEELQEQVKALTAEKEKAVADATEAKKKLEEALKNPPPQMGDIPAMLEKKLEEATKQLQEMQAREKKSQHDLLISRLLQENKITATPAFQKILEKCADEKEIKEAIEDRKKAVSSSIRSQGISEKFEAPAKEIKESLRSEILTALRS